MLKKQKLLGLSCLIFSLCGFSQADACTRVLHTDKGQAVVVGRNMDWFDDMHTKLVVLPQGIPQDGSDPMSHTNPIHWVSKYGSVVATAYNAGATDGMNEKGFAAHILWLNGSDYGQRDQSVPGLSVMKWLQFYLDNFQSVAEAVSYTETNPLQITPFLFPNPHMWINVHLAIEDASGDSAIIEYTGGKVHVYHNPGYTVLTNDPAYNLQLQNLEQYEVVKKPLPGTSSPTDRFVRATYYEKNIPQNLSLKDELAAVMSILQNTGAPFIEVNFNNMPVVSRTIWRTVVDLTHRNYYYTETGNLGTVYVQLSKFNLSPGSPIMQFDAAGYPDVAGDVTAKFEPVVMRDSVKS